jgi:hypothetical protein
MSIGDPFPESWFGIIAPPYRSIVSSPTSIPGEHALQNPNPEIPKMGDAAHPFK